MSHTLRERLSTWKALGRTEPLEEDPGILAGRQGENFLRDFVQGHVEFQNSHIFLGKRVPRKKGRKEIDLMVVTPKRIHIIEAKNWSGALQVRGDKWVQVRRKGQEVEHPNLLDYNLQKMDILIEYLGGKGLSLSRDFFCQKVIFVNPRLKVDEKLSENLDVITPSKLEGYLNQHKRKGLSEGMLCSVIEFCLGSDAAQKMVKDLFKSLTKENYTTLLRELDGLSTWDRLDYYGNKSSTGDFLKLKVGDRYWRKNRLGEIRSLEIRWSRNRFWGLIKALFRIGTLGSVKVDGETLSLSAEDKVLFHFAGQPDPELVPLTKVEEIVLGKGGQLRKKGGWGKWILALLVFLALLAGLFYFLYKSKIFDF